MHTRYVQRAIHTALASTLLLALVACNKPPESATADAVSPASLGTVIDDAVVTTAVKAALLADEQAKGLEIKVETRKGEVLLSGFVDSEAHIDRAVAVAKGVAGVTAVQNNMALQGGPTTVGMKVDDGIMTARVKTALLADDAVKSFDVKVVTREGEVQLSGFVDNQNQIDRALTVAKHVEGVSAVINDLSIKK